MATARAGFDAGWGSARAGCSTVAAAQQGQPQQLDAPRPPARGVLARQSTCTGWRQRLKLYPHAMRDDMGATVLVDVLAVPL
mmetsp:Transcript_95680/g.308889  ORF Transcript_95680/g.308889 Transcript_95680/m.308889 type:complete len:82 (+) Transcript_95680:1776-2021(+)